MLGFLGHVKYPKKQFLGIFRNWRISNILCGASHTGLSIFLALFQLLIILPQYFLTVYLPHFQVPHKQKKTKTLSADQQKTLELERKNRDYQLVDADDDLSEEELEASTFKVKMIFSLNQKWKVQVSEWPSLPSIL